MRATMLCLLIVSGTTACGFDCDVQGEKRPFSGCDALQQAYDAEQSRLDQPPSGAVLDDLVTCGEVQGCEIAP